MSQHYSTALVDYYNNSCNECKRMYSPLANYVCKQVTNYPKRFSAFRCINLDEEEQHPFLEPELYEEDQRSFVDRNGNQYARR